MKIRTLMVLLAMLAVYSCNDDAKSDITLENREVNISFAAQTDVVVKAGTRAEASDLVTASNFTFYAFKKGADGNFSFTKKISDVNSTYVNKLWKSDEAILPVGTYRFICFYNLPDTNISTEEALEALGSKSWDDIKNGIIIEHNSTTADMAEFFSGESKGEIQINSNDVVVNIEDALKRVVSRIDVKFIKITEDGKNEVLYSEGNTIFGASDNLKSITLGVEGAAKKYSLYTVVPDAAKWTEKLNFAYTDPLGSGLAIIGESTSNSIFPKGDGSNVNNKDDMRSDMIRGAAYFRGSYILPFVSKDKLTEIQINILGKDDANRTIVATENLYVEKNFVTLVTVKLKSSTPSEGEGPSIGDDDEHLFNPRVKFEVSIDNLFAGVYESGVEVE